MSKRKHPETRYHRRLYDSDQPFYPRIEPATKGKRSYKREQKNKNNPLNIKDEE